MRQSNQTSILSRAPRPLAPMVICLTLIASAGGAQPTRAPSTLQPEAITALRQMGSYLRMLKEFSVDAMTTREEVMRTGEKVQVAGTVQYLVRPPDRLRADLRTDRKQRQILYNGRDLTIFAPRMLVYATVAAPPTIGTMLDTAHQRLRIDFPLADLFLWGTKRDGVKDLTSARYVGPAYIDGTDTDQYAFRQRGTDWQLWIQRGSTPLPRKLVISTTSDPARPEYVATLKWNLAGKFNDSLFSFVPPTGAQRILIADWQAAKASTRAPHAPARRGMHVQP